MARTRRSEGPPSGCPDHDLAAETLEWLCGLAAHRRHIIALANDDSAPAGASEWMHRELDALDQWVLGWSPLSRDEAGAPSGEDSFNARGLRCRGAQEAIAEFLRPYKNKGQALKSIVSNRPPASEVVRLAHRLAWLASVPFDSPRIEDINGLQPGPTAVDQMLSLLAKHLAHPTVLTRLNAAAGGPMEAAGVLLARLDYAGVGSLSALHRLNRQWRELHDHQPKRRARRR
jgi:hypothetical protein